MNANTAERHLRLAELLEVDHPEEELFIVYSPRGPYAWGWGYSLEGARAGAIACILELDEVEPRDPEEPTPEAYVADLPVMRVRVRHRQALDLLALIGLNEPAGQSRAVVGGKVYPLAR